MRSEGYKTQRRWTFSNSVKVITRCTVISMTVCCYYLVMANKQSRRCHLNDFTRGHAHHWEVGRRCKCYECGRVIRHRPQCCIASLESIPNDKNSFKSVQQWLQHQRRQATPTANKCYIFLHPKKQAADCWRNCNAHANNYWTSDITFYCGQEASRRWSICTTTNTVCAINVCLFKTLVFMVSET